MDTIVVGIDVSKDKLDIAVRPSGDAFATSRDAAGLDAVIARLVPLSPAAVAVEATGGFETIVAAAGEAAVVSGCGGLPVVVVNPAQVRSFAQALGKRAKTDPIDAAVIAHFAEATKPDIRPLPETRRRNFSPVSSPSAARSSK
jgi:transposase